MKYALPVVLALLLAACGGGTAVDPAPQPITPPTIDSFTATPPTIANAGDPATLNWSISGTYDNLQLTDSVSTNAINVSGTSFTVYPSTTTTYRLTASGSAGVTTQVATVVLQGTDPTPQPVPTPGPDPVDPGQPKPAKPTINSFKASPLTIQPGGSAVLSWNVSGATGLKIDNGVGSVSGTSTNVSPSKTTTYTLTATNAGGNATAKATVTVAGAEQPTNNYIGRWLVTFTGPDDSSTFVHELDIFDGSGEGKEVLCHSGLRGTLCSNFTQATGKGYIFKDQSTGIVAIGLQESDPNGYFMYAENLTLTTGSNGRQYLDGKAGYSPYEGEFYEGTVHAENVAAPRPLN